MCHRVLQISVLILVLWVLKIFVLVAYLRTRLSKQYKSRWDNFNVPVNPTHHHLIFLIYRWLNLIFSLQKKSSPRSHKLQEFNFFHSISLHMNHLSHAKYKFFHMAIIWPIWYKRYRVYKTLEISVAISHGPYGYYPRINQTLFPKYRIL